jgi:hypothetical protein
MHQLIDQLTNNPTYAIIAIVVLIILVFFVIKKLFKLLIYGIIIFIGFLVYVYYTGGDVKKTIENAKLKGENMIEKLK